MMRNPVLFIFALFLLANAKLETGLEVSDRVFLANQKCCEILSASNKMVKTGIEELTAKTEVQAQTTQATTINCGESENKLQLLKKKLSGLKNETETWRSKLESKILQISALVHKNEGSLKTGANVLDKLKNLVAKVQQYHESDVNKINQLSGVIEVLKKKLQVAEFE